MDWIGSVSGIPSSVWNVLLRGTFCHIDGDFCGIKVGHVAICNLQFSEEEKCACSNPSESEVSTNMCESSTTSYLLRWLEIVFFWRARILGANCASFRESLTPKDTLTTNSNKDYDTKSWQKSQKTFPFYNKHTYSFQVFLS